MRGLLAVLLLASGAGAAPLPRGPREASLETLKTFLDHGLWNDRITALYALGDWGAEGLPLLAYSSDDADWQVRLTVVHFLGKLGAPAAPALDAVLREEPCRHVRLSALQWLAGMGEGGASVYRAHATPEDERDLATRAAETGRMGKPVVVDAPGGMSASFFHGGTDFRACASSERSGRRARALPEAAAAPAPEAAAPRAELEALLAQKTPPRLAEEDLPRRPGLPPRPESEPAAVERAAVPPRAGAPARQVGRDLGDKETLSSMPGLAPRVEPGGAAPALAEDAGTGRVERDAVPALIEQLRHKDPRRRARAADELGKRGEAARPAVPALRRALSDRDRRVRASAALALGSAGSHEVVEDLARVLRDKDEDVRFSARVALDRLRR